MSRIHLIFRKLVCLLVILLGTMPASAQDGWFYNDVGTVGTAGASVFNAGTGAFTVTSSGSDIGGYVDSFGFNYRIMTGDGALIARLNSVPANPAAETGLMMRNDLTPRSVSAALLVSGGNQIAFQHRAAAGGDSQVTASTAVTLPLWLKLVRAGSTLTGYRSTDGVAWT